MPKIYFASDHAGFELKNALVAQAKLLGYEVEDLGAHESNPADDYPTFITPCAERVAAEPGAFGVIIGGSGQGEAMAANRVKGARAGVYYGGPVDLVRLMRDHNDANILSLGARFVTGDEAREALQLFLATPFSGDVRHRRRLAMF